MHKRLFLLLCTASLASCNEPVATRTDSGAKDDVESSVPSELPPGPETDPCSLLTSEDIQAVLGEPLKGVRRNEKIEGILKVSQCFFELPTVSQSVVLTLTQKSGAPEARNPREVWVETFTGDKNKASTGRRKIAPPRAIEGLGDGAFWAGNPKFGSLYVLKGNSYFRLNIGGEESTDEKIEKCKALAEKVLGREF